MSIAYFVLTYFKVILLTSWSNCRGGLGGGTVGGAVGILLLAAITAEGRNVGDPDIILRCSVIVGGNGGRTATPKPNGRAPASPLLIPGSGVSPGVHFSSVLLSPPSLGKKFRISQQK